MRLIVRKRLGSRDLAGPDMHRPIPSKPKTPAPDCPGGEVDPISGNMLPGTSMIATPDVDGASFGMDSRGGIVHLHVETPIASSIGLRRKNVPCRKMPAPNQHVIAKSSEIVAALRTPKLRSHSPT